MFETNLKRMLAYSSVAQIGYITLGIGLANQAGLTGGLVHVVNHALMKAALFLAVGAIFYRGCTVRLEELAGIGRKMPLTMAAFTIAGFGLVGTPGTSGFISKWYLAVGALDKGWWILVFLIVGSSMIALVYVGRVLEVAWLREPAPQVAEASDPPLSMLLPLVVLALATDLFRLRHRMDGGHRQHGREVAARWRCDDGALVTGSARSCGSACAVRAALSSFRCSAHRPNLRETVTLVTAALLCLVAVGLLGPVLGGGRPEVNVDPGRAGPRARLQGRAARDAVRARRVVAVDRQLDLFDRLHAGE